jgi:hypothetical protein
LKRISQCGHFTANLQLEVVMEASSQAFLSAVKAVCPGTDLNDEELAAQCQRVVQELERLQESQPARQQETRSTSQDVLDMLLSQLDNSVQSLCASLDALPGSMLEAPAHQLDPKQVVAYAHRLRYTSFFRAGTICLPPTPQVWQMAQGVLQRYNQQQAARMAAQAAAPPAVVAQQQQQQQQQRQPALPQAPQQPAQPPKAETYPEGYALNSGQVLLSDGTAAGAPAAAPVPAIQAPPAAAAAAVPAQQPPPAAPPAAGITVDHLDLLLNPDLMEEASVSDSDSDEDDF